LLGFTSNGDVPSSYGYNEKPPAIGDSCIFVDDVPAALDFYRRALGLETRFFDEALQYGELDTVGR